MTGYVVRRLLQVALVVLGVSTFMFFILRLSGDPALLFVSDAPSTEEIARVREQLGFNDPLPIQYARYLGAAATGDFGRSLKGNAPAMELVLQRLPATLELTAVAIVAGALLAIPAGVLSAFKPGSLYDTLVTTLASLGQSLPPFLIGILLILLFAVELRVLPTSGRGEWQQVVLPGVTLGLFFIGRLARVTRSSVLDVLSREYVTTARAKGLTERTVVVRHVLRNASLAIMTVLGYLVATVLSGAIVTETVFAWPGIGTLLVQAVQVRDFPIVQASVFVIALFVALANLATDLAYAYLDPRIRLR